MGVAKTIEASQRTGQLRALLLSICLNNSVMRAKEGLSGKPHYFGTSADEVAILEKLYSSVGYFIVSRSVTAEGEEMEVHTEPNDDVGRTWELLYVYKYTSERGMMTVQWFTVCCNSDMFFLTPFGVRVVGDGEEQGHRRSVLPQ